MTAASPPSRSAHTLRSGVSSSLLTAPQSQTSVCKLLTLQWARPGQVPGNHRDPRPRGRQGRSAHTDAAARGAGRSLTGVPTSSYEPTLASPRCWKSDRPLPRAALGREVPFAKPLPHVRSWAIAAGRRDRTSDGARGRGGRTGRAGFIGAGAGRPVGHAPSARRGPSAGDTAPAVPHSLGTWHRAGPHPPLV